METGHICYTSCGYCTFVNVQFVSIFTLQSLYNCCFPPKCFVSLPATRNWSDCLVRLSGQTVWSDCLVRLSGQTVWSDCLVRLSGQTVWSDCLVRLSGQTVELAKAQSTFLLSISSGMPSAFNLVQ